MNPLRLALLALLLLSPSAHAVRVEVTPSRPTPDDEVLIEIHDAVLPGTMHWGINAEGNQWKQAPPHYRPANSAMEGVATRTLMDGPDSNGVCRVVLGPFSDTNHVVKSIDFVIQWENRSWENFGEKDYHVPVGPGRIAFSADEAVNRTLEGESVILEPRMGTLVAFLAGDHWHEVLPARKMRMSITGWFRVRAS